MRRRVVVGVVLAAGLLTAGSAAAGPERAHLVSEQELPPVYAQGVARADDLHVLTIAESINLVYFGHFSVGGQPPDTDPPPVTSGTAASDDLDPGWPPVLIAAVLAVVAGAAIVGVMFYRRARSAARGQ